MENQRILRTTAFVLLAVAGVAALGVLLVRDQISRSRRDLFSPHPLRRLAALEYLDGEEPSVNTILLLRDFLAWEPRPLLRKRAAAVLGRLEEGLAGRGHPLPTEVA
ncbi:MAG TPA: hypothetical protein VFX98_04050 [Longimicrobiaceae bacterium]|nr:hypothetical protein [Longimicrobiaceae bacterium]